MVVEVLGQGQLVDLERALELAHHATVVLEFLFRLLAAVQLERLQPLRETLELALRLQLIREDLKTSGANWSTLSEDSTFGLRRFRPKTPKVLL